MRSFCFSCGKFKHFSFVQQVEHHVETTPLNKCVCTPFRWTYNRSKIISIALVASCIWTSPVTVETNCNQQSQNTRKVKQQHIDKRQTTNRNLISKIISEGIHDNAEDMVRHTAHRNHLLGHCLRGEVRLNFKGQFCQDRLHAKRILHHLGSKKHHFSLLTSGFLNHHQ